jgi:hypothetical protein
MSVSQALRSRRKTSSTVALYPPTMEEERIERWLIEGPAQQRTGNHQGAIAGWVDADGCAEYVYPEIAGYYLQWLAWKARWPGPRDRLGTRARATQRWLAAWIETDATPQTRLYLAESRSDWRNDFVFAFDLAMVLRGLASAHRLGLIAFHAALVERLCHQLSRLIAPDGQLDACRRHRTSGDAPERWSTRRGAFLAKAAAGILAAGATLPAIPRDLVEAAERTFVASIDELILAPHAETHPFFYAIEGFLSLPDRRDFSPGLEPIAARFQALMAESASLGRVPEVRGGAEQTRLDVVAQALRVGVLLGTHLGAGRAETGQREFLTHVLTQQVAASGALPFAVGALPVQLNVWTAMFAEQALALTRLPPAELRRFAADPCIV